MSYLDDPEVYKAGLVVIGNEILSGRTQDKNTHWVAERLGRHGVALREVRVVPDIEAKIIEAVNALRAEMNYVFTTGGIGPTHDDITAESVAKAFGVKLARHEEAYKALVRHYGSEDQITAARAKMAMIPEGASLIPNPVSGAPGFIMENVYVMAGVPRIMQAMFDFIVQEHLQQGKIVLSNTLMCALAESALADGLEGIQTRYEMVDIGSYPHFRDGVSAVSIVLRGIDEGSVKAATQEVIGLMERLGATPNAMSLQVPV